jgi:hypothetical protein
MTDLVTALAGRLPADVQGFIRRRVGAMLREITYLVTTGSDVVPERFALTTDALEALCALNSFYQVVIVPLRTASPHWAPVKNPILYGKQMRFDESWRRNIRATTGAFFWMTRRLGVSRELLTAAHGRDLLAVLRREQENEL